MNMVDFFRSRFGVKLLSSKGKECVVFEVYRTERGFRDWFRVV